MLEHVYIISLTSLTMKTTKAKRDELLQTLDMDQYWDVTSLIYGVSNYDSTLYDSDCWGE